MCAALLHGALQQASGNKHAGPPADRDGKVITNPSAQPPCFLRYSPQLFAAEAPAWFTHDPITNRLSLKPGVPKPWMRQPHPSFQVDDPRRWLYCADCKERFFPDAGERAAHSFVTYRDRASTNFMKPVRRRRYQGSATGQDEEASPPQQPPQQTQPQEAQEMGEPVEYGTDVDGGADEVPGLTGIGLGGMAMDVDEEDENEGRRRTRFEQRGYVPNLPDAPVRRPTLAEYQARWATELAKHTRSVPGPFSRDNLVPEPIEELFQDAPHLPFSKLRSVASQARLSVCRPHSALEEPNVRSGVGRYAHLTGDAQYLRRAPQQLNSMMGFVLNRRGGRFMGLTQEETDALHEILTWGRQPGNNRTSAGGING